MSLLRRAAVPLVILALLVTAGIVMFGGDSDRKTVVAYFPRTIAIYEGSELRILGVPVGQVDDVEPEGTRVKVTMSYEPETKVPADAKAVIVSPAIVGDRYVQLTPAYGGGDVLADNTVLDEGRTAVPVELDDIYSSIDDLTVALGPTGANENGALTDLLESTAKNFGGQGAQFKTTIGNFAKLSTTLDDNKEELFGSLEELQGFITTLAESDSTVRRFNDSLGQVSTLLAGEREELAGSLKNLATALDQVGTFVQENRAVLGRDIKGLNRVSKVLVRQRANLDETLRLAPVALNNLALAYNPDAGTLDTNANIGELVNEITGNPKNFLCALVSSNDNNGALCDLIQTLPLPRVGPFGAGTGSSYGDQFDPTLGGLVEVTQ